MKNSRKTLECKFERTIPAPLGEGFDGWLDPKIPGNPWNAADKLMLNPEVERPGRIQHTWVSPNTLGEESMVTVTFKKQGEETLMTLVHSDLPDHELARGHEKGWNYFLEIFREQFGIGSRKKYRLDDAHLPVKK